MTICRTYQKAVQIVLGLFLSSVMPGCVAPLEPLAAKTNLSGVACDDVFDLENPTEVSLLEDDNQDNIFVDAVVDDQSPCFRSEAGAKSSYAVFTIKDVDPLTMTVVVGSRLELGRILAPLVVVLSEEGEFLRSYGADRFLYRGDHLSVSFRPKADDYYIVVKSNSDIVGDGYDNIKTLVTHAHIPVGYSLGAIPASADLVNNTVYSHYGIARLRLYRNE